MSSVSLNGVRNLAKIIVLPCIDYLNLRLSRKLRGEKFVVLLKGRRGLGLLKQEDSELTKILESILVQQEGCFIDVGANIGHTFLKVKSINREMQYVGFEPNVISCAYLQELILANRFLDSAVMPVALGDAADVLPLNVRDAENLADSCASLRTDNRPKGFFSHKFVALVQSGDEVVEALNINSISAIKIDVEGSEPSVLRGFSKTIKKIRPNVIIEILGPTTTLSPTQLEVRYATASEIQDWAVLNYYSISNIGRNGILKEVKDLREFLSSAFTPNYLLQPIDEETN